MGAELPLLVALLAVSVFIAFIVPPLSKSRPSFTTVLLYVIAELAALVIAVWLVVQVSSFELLPVLIALAIAAHARAIVRPMSFIEGIEPSCAMRSCIG